MILPPAQQIQQEMIKDKQYKLSIPAIDRVLDAIKRINQQAEAKQ